MEFTTQFMRPVTILFSCSFYGKKIPPVDTEGKNFKRVFKKQLIVF